MNPTSRELVSAITDFYKLITKLPYIDSTALIYPPSQKSEEQQGWLNINAEELRKRGRTEEVITLLRHLPYLQRPVSGGSKREWMIGPDTHAVTYCDGEVYDEQLDKIQPTPGHCIWLASPADTEDGAALLLDVENGGFFVSRLPTIIMKKTANYFLGTITEYSVRSNRNVCLDAEQYDALPLEDRWMAHSTLPATDFFRTWTNKYKKLEWMPFLKGEELGSAIWFISPKKDDEIFDDAYSEDSDESYEPSSEESDDDDYDSEDYDDESDDPYEYDSEYESDDGDDISVDQDTIESKVQDLSIDDGDVLTDKAGGLSRNRLECEIRSGNSKLLATEKPILERVVNVR